VDRDAIVAELAAEILAAAAAGEKWRPDYAALMARTGYKRSWCEKAVRDARQAVFRTEAALHAPTGNAGEAA
jgi:transposase